MIKTTLDQWQVELHGSGMIWIEELRLLCASDIHLGKGSFFHQFGALLPAYDVHETLHKLEQAIAYFKPDIFIALGDSFHDKKAGERMEAAHKDLLNQMIHNTKRWVWITGNHDPHIADDIGGQRQAEITFGNLTFRHELKNDSLPEVSGHYHPKTSVTLRGRKITAPCFVQRHNKCILPSFGSYTGGLDINTPDFLKIIPANKRQIYLVYNKNVYGLK